MSLSDAGSIQEFPLIASLAVHKTSIAFGVTNDGKILVADPASYDRSTKKWDVTVILGEVKNAGSGGPFWSLSCSDIEE